jgi:prepilin signal peptidase PulO-like enzyme (type II secretory pathway)
MGGGDIKFITAAGALLGLQQVVLIIFISSFMGSLVGLVGLAGKKVNALSQIPFGPFLSGATLIVYFWGEQIIQMYIMNITGGVEFYR